MAIIKKNGKLFCTICKRPCDSTCWETCKNYRKCNTCEHLCDESGYCDDCSIGDNDKWEDHYEH